MSLKKSSDTGNPHLSISMVEKGSPKPKPDNQNNDDRDHQVIEMSERRKKSAYGVVRGVLGRFAHGGERSAAAV